jgi:transposase
MIDSFEQQGSYPMSYSVDLRERVVAYVAQGGTKVEAAEIFEVGRRRIYRWLASEDLSPKPAKTRRRKLDKTLLAAHVREHSDMILRERAEHFGVRVNAVWVALQQIKISKKNDAVRGKSFR